MSPDPTRSSSSRRLVLVAVPRTCRTQAARGTHGPIQADTSVAPEQGVCATARISCLPVPPSRGGDTGSNLVGTTSKARSEVLSGSGGPSRLVPVPHLSRRGPCYVADRRPELSRTRVADSDPLEGELNARAEPTPERPVEQSPWCDAESGPSRTITGSTSGSRG
jgi:hypothetical protein